MHLQMENMPLSEIEQMYPNEKIEIRNIRVQFEGVMLDLTLRCLRSDPEDKTSRIFTHREIECPVVCVKKLKIVTQWREIYHYFDVYCERKYYAEIHEENLVISDIHRNYEIVVGKWSDDSWYNLLDFYLFMNRIKIHQFINNKLSELVAELKQMPVVIYTSEGTDKTTSVSDACESVKLDYQTEIRNFCSNLKLESNFILKDLDAKLTRILIQ